MTTDVERLNDAEPVRTRRRSKIANYFKDSRLFQLVAMQDFLFK